MARHMKKYRKKPLVIEAVKYIDPWPQINADLRDWGLTDWHFSTGWSGSKHLIIKTLEGEMECKIGDYIVKGIKGEFYPVAQDIFIESYEECDQ